MSEGLALSRINFKITLQTPLKLPSERSYRDEDGRIYISAVSMKGVLRKSLSDLIETRRAEKGIEDEIFGMLSGEITKAAKIAISPAVAEGPVETDYQTSVKISRETLSAEAQNIYKSEIVPKETVFSGVIHSQLPENSAEGMALRLALLSIQNLGRGYAAGWGLCDVEIIDHDTSSEVLYDLDLEIPPKRIEAANLWIPGLEKELLDHFARKPEEMRLMPPRAFEELVAALFRKEGFSVQLTPETRDGGFDILAVRHDRLTGNETLLVECKRYAERRHVGVDVVRKLRGVTQFENATKGIIATTAFFTSEAKRIAQAISARLVLHDYDFLKQWLQSITR